MTSNYGYRKNSKEKEAEKIQSQRGVFHNFLIIKPKDVSSTRIRLCVFIISYNNILSKQNINFFFGQLKKT